MLEMLCVKYRRNTPLVDTFNIYGTPFWAMQTQYTECAGFIAAGSVTMSKNVPFTASVTLKFICNDAKCESYFPYTSHVAPSVRPVGVVTGCDIVELVLLFRNFLN